MKSSDLATNFELEKPVYTTRTVSSKCTAIIFICIGIGIATSLVALSISIWATVKSSSEASCSVEWQEQVQTELTSLRTQASTLASTCECINTGEGRTDSNNIVSETVSNAETTPTTESGSEVVPPSLSPGGDVTDNRFSAIGFTINGQLQTKFVIFAEWARQYVQVNTTSVTLQGGGRVYLGNRPTGENNMFTTDVFYQVPLLGKRLTFEVDMSQVGCNCNGALYFIDMPAHDSSQQPAPGEHGDYYCDANGVGGFFCPEMDVLESNKFAMSTTAHTCTYVPSSYYSNCDGDGCATNILAVDINAFGPGRRIDTNYPFTLSTQFIQGQGGLLTTVRNTLTQGSETFQFDVCNPDYLQHMGPSLPEIVMSISLWGTGDGGLAWLDGRSGCRGACNLAQSSVTFSNFRLDDL